MTKQWILLGGLVVALGAFAQKNADMNLDPVQPDSSYQGIGAADSIRQEAAVGASAEATPADSQAALVNWLNATERSSQPRRLVIDGLFPQAAPAPTDTNASVLVRWEQSAVIYWKGEKVDSFLVSASRTGCPGTEVRASIAVSFATGSGWSFPPIRFGPLGDHVICPLGEGLKLEVFGDSGVGPRVRVSSRVRTYGSRR